MSFADQVRPESLHVQALRKAGRYVHPAVAPAVQDALRAMAVDQNIEYTSDADAIGVSMFHAMEKGDKPYRFGLRITIPPRFDRAHENEWFRALSELTRDIVTAQPAGTFYSEREIVNPNKSFTIYGPTPDDLVDIVNTALLIPHNAAYQVNSRELASGRIAQGSIAYPLNYGDAANGR